MDTIKHAAKWSSFDCRWLIKKFLSVQRRCISASWWSSCYGYSNLKRNAFTAASRYGGSFAPIDCEWENSSNLEISLASNQRLKIRPAQTPPRPMRHSLPPFGERPERQVRKPPHIHTRHIGITTRKIWGWRHITVDLNAWAMTSGVR